MKLPILTPCHDGMYSGNYITSLYATAAAGLSSAWINSMYDSSIVRHRSKLAAYALKELPDAEAFLWIDADMGWTVADIRRISSLPPSLDVVGGVYVKKTDVPVTPVYRQDGDAGVEWASDRNVISVSRIGFGFVRMSRVAMQHAVDTGEKTSGGWTVAFPEGLVNGEWETEDYNFCHRQQQAGRTIWMDRSIRLTHRGAKEYRA